MFGWHGYGGGFMWIFWILVIGALIWLVVTASRDRGSGVSGRDESALEILRRRYARGEIDRDEFEQKKKDLEE
jgi:putative membrane protein